MTNTAASQKQHCATALFILHINQNPFQKLNRSNKSLPIAHFRYLGSVNGRSFSRPVDSEMQFSAGLNTKQKVHVMRKAPGLVTESNLVAYLAITGPLSHLLVLIADSAQPHRAGPAVVRNSTFAANVLQRSK